MKRLSDKTLNTLEGLTIMMVAILWLAIFVHPWAGAAIWGASIVLNFKISDEVYNRTHKKWKVCKRKLDEMEN